MITRELAQKALSKLSTPVAWEYFFDNLKSAAWIKPLSEVKSNIFKKPSQAIKNDNGWTLSRWPESRYLARVADQAPSEIVKIFLNMDPTNNAFIHDDFGDVALKIPLAEARKMIPKLITYLDSEVISFLPEKCAELSEKFAAAKDCAISIQLLSKVLDLDVTPHTGSSGTPFQKDKVRTRYFGYHYQQILKKTVPKIVSSCGIPAVSMIRDKLVFALTVEGDLRKVANDYSYIWRPAIENPSQDSSDSIKECLVDAVINAYRTHIEKLPKDAAALVGALVQSDFAVLKRIGLFLLGLDTLNDSTLLKDTLKTPLFYDLIPTWREFSHLLKKRLASLSNEEQQVIFNLVRNMKPENPDEEKSVHQCKVDKYRIYCMMPQEIASTQKEFESLRAEIGELEHPDLHHTTGHFWVGPTSPIESADLNSKTPEEIIEFLKSWKPDKKWFSASPEGLGRTLETIVKEDPDKVLAAHEDLSDLNPTYLRSIVQALRDTEKKFDWPIVLNLCREIAGKNENETKHPTGDEDEDPGFKWVQAAVARLLTKGFEKNSIPWDLRSEAWEVLHLVTLSSDPNAEHEAKYLLGSKDYYQYSINTTRGEALHGVIAYALWVKRQAKLDDSQSFFTFAPEVEEVLSNHLNPDFDAQVGMRAVYGRWLPWLILLDKAWVSNNIGKIFPKESSLWRYREAAWNTYVVFCGVYKNVFDTISNEFLDQIEKISTLSEAEISQSDPASRLAEHLMVHFWQGDLGEASSSTHINKFFSVAPAKVRRRALSFIGRALNNEQVEEISTSILNRFMNLWNWRKTFPLEVIKSELPQFGWWAISKKFDPIWALNELDWVIRTTGFIEPESLIFEKLHIYIPDHYKKLLSIAHGFVDGPLKNGSGWLVDDHLMIFLTSLREKLNLEERQEFIDLIDKLVSMGHLKFRPLVRF